MDTVEATLPSRMTATEVEPLQQYARWTESWRRAMDYYARMTTDAMSEFDADSALRFARRYTLCKRRFMAALIREQCNGRYASACDPE